MSLFFRHIYHKDGRINNKYFETHSRSIAKTISYRIIGAVVTAMIAWLLTGQFKVAVSVGLVDTLVKIGVYYGHERLWNRLPFGLAKEPDYSI